MKISLLKFLGTLKRTADLCLVGRGTFEYNYLILGFSAMASKNSLRGLQALHSGRGLLT
jgi:hypothetical protein